MTQQTQQARPMSDDGSKGLDGGTATTAADIPEQQTEMSVDELAKTEKKVEEIENRPQRLASDLLEQKHRLQKCIFYVALTVICVFYFFFLLTVMRLVCSADHEIFKKEFSASATVLIGMLGSIPTILTAFLMTGLFKEKEHKDKEKDEKSPLGDLSTLAKVMVEAAKAARPH